MDDGALYRSMLAAVSHAQQHRHAQIQGGEAGHHLQVGNVFLPAIHKRTLPQSALSMKHLQVIEQCILAENRREAQLAQCSSEHERRYLIKKFRAQRDHERDLIQALTLGQPAPEELQITDMDATLASYNSPLLRTPKSPEKVIKMLGEKTFASNSPTRKQPTKPSPTRLHDEYVRKLAHSRSNEPPSSNVNLDKSPQTKPFSGQKHKVQRLSSSASLMRKASHSPSPKKAHTTPPKLPPTLKNSPLNSSTRKATSNDLSARVPRGSPSPTKKTKPQPRPSEAVEMSMLEDNSEPITVTFDGATRFFEARQLAMAIAHEQKGLVEGETQTTSREDTPDLDRQKYVLMLTKDAGLRASLLKIRPHSSPEPRRRRLSADSHFLPSLTHSSTAEFELFHATVSTPGGVPGVRTFVSTDCFQKVRVFPHDKAQEVVEKQLAWREPHTEGQDPIQDRAESSSQDVQCEAKDGDYEDEGTNDNGASTITREVETIDQHEDHEIGDDTEISDQDAYNPEFSNYEFDDEGHADSAEGVEMAVDESIEAQGESEADCDYHDYEELITLIYDMINQVESDNELQEVPLLPIGPEKMIEPGPETRRASLVSFGRFVIRIQSAFRGHRARRSFRFALYQEALQCGVLGAMPGTLQGRSGWYQDPKSFMAYYFVVRPDGEWRQKIVLRCSGLILTPYQMHEQILNRVHVPPDED